MIVKLTYFGAEFETECPTDLLLHVFITHLSLSGSNHRPPLMLDQDM